MFVHPGQVREVTTRHPEIRRARLVVENRDHQDEMTLHCEVASVDPALAARIAETLQAVCKLRGRVALARPGELADDGKTIIDLRKYD
jgi:phenylacetate-CoA ligase